MLYDFLSTPTSRLPLFMYGPRRTAAADSGLFGSGAVFVLVTTMSGSTYAVKASAAQPAATQSVLTPFGAGGMRATAELAVQV